MKLIKLYRSFSAIWSLLKYTKNFEATEEFKNKRVAIIGAANSVLEEENGTYIDGFDVVIRINKAPHNFTRENAPFIGTKITHLFHSFYENNFSGGGPIDWELYDHIGIKKVINPNRTFRGLITHLNYYKRHKENKNTFVLTKSNYKLACKGLEGFIPTIGFSSLMLLLQTECQELYVSGFTFFKTPYISGYRDDLLDMSKNKLHIESQGIHNPQLEFELFLQTLKTYKPKKVIFDAQLNRIIGASFTL